MTSSGFSGSFSRRDLVGLGALALAAPGGSGALWRSAAAATAAAETSPLQRFPHMVQEYFVARLREVHARRLERLARIQARADAEEYVREVRDKIRLAFGPFPSRTPLKPRITGVLERDAYKVEKVIFESRPGFLVTANLYVPKGRAFPLPGVVGVCGHSAEGKSGDTYQAFSQGLARQGYVVLIIDPIGQGERLQYVDDQLQPRRGVGTREHNYAGNQQHLVGEFFGAWRAWDGIRALDYLMTREEVDLRHLGITGNSGGGTMTTWLCGLDQRWTMAAPGCFVTEFRRNLENELPADSEQCPPRALALGLDHEDFVAALAPKPVILLGKERDYFDARGLEAAFRRLKQLYSLLGAEDNIALFIGPSYHGYSQENREAMYQWFNRATGISGGGEPKLVIEKQEALWCCPRGQVAGLASKPICQFTREASQQLGKSRVRLSGPGLVRTVAEVLRIPERTGAPVEYRILRPLRVRGYPLEHVLVYLVDSEPGVHAVVYRITPEPLYSRPRGAGRRALLYVAHRSSDAELRAEPLVRELLAAEPEADFYACDVRGIGESQPETCTPGSFEDAYGSDYFYAAHALMLDRPYLGQRTQDVLAVLRWLRESGYTGVHLAGRGWGALPALFAAVLDPWAAPVTLKHGLNSYAEVAESESYNWPLALLPAGLLKFFDLTDCYRELESRKLRRIEPWGADPA